MCQDSKMNPSFFFFFLLYQLTAVSNGSDPTNQNQIPFPTQPAPKICVSWNKMCVCVGKKQSDLLFTLQEVFGYQTQKLRRVLFLVTSVLTCGVLPLLFYWKPQWRVWAYCIPCSLQEADTVLLRTTVRALLCCIQCMTCDDQHSRADPP